MPCAKSDRLQANDRGWRRFASECNRLSTSQFPSAPAIDLLYPLAQDIVRHVPQRTQPAFSRSPFDCLELPDCQDSIALFASHSGKAIAIHLNAFRQRAPSALSVWL